MGATHRERKIGRRQTRDGRPQAAAETLRRHRPARRGGGDCIIKTPSPGRERTPRAELWRWPGRRAVCARARRGRRPRRSRATKGGSRRRWVCAWFSASRIQPISLARARALSSRSPIALTANREGRRVVARGGPVAGQVARRDSKRRALLLDSLRLLDLLLPPAAGDAAGPADAPSDHHRHLCCFCCCCCCGLRRARESGSALKSVRDWCGSVVVVGCASRVWSRSTPRIGCRA